jgi:iron complex transport system ATP-binding protein
MSARTDHALTATALTLAYDGHPVVHAVDLAVPPGLVTAIVGANASGKSTLLRGLARLLRPAGGGVTLDGSDIHRMPTRQVATILGLLPQEPRAPEAITVEDLVSRGRTPHRGRFGRWTDSDRRAVDDALAATATTPLAGRRVDALSGGQRQRVWIAMALAQDPEILMLDEPTSFLDLAHQIDVLELVRDLNRARGATVVMVLHELNLATRYADHIVVMRHGGILAAGDPRQVMTADVIRDAFGIDAHVMPDPVGGRPMVIPLGRAGTANAP